MPRVGDARHPAPVRTATAQVRKTELANGTVGWVNLVKGCGFIAVDDGTRISSFIYPSIEMGACKVLEEDSA
ncbi:hypothetical protein SAMN06296378_0329 [Salinibacterium xinjiangense]|uniref:Cold shock protein, CspA family n=1 Tax=Salinibacterium xinjiangense TaxID=386302 RepID=A0A2C8YH71_9MICO|nr:hypothetical protein SAMN06296378_0329 [Salinibacterium xinjiangense]